jgi:hypothetical protein
MTDDAVLNMRLRDVWSRLDLPPAVGSSDELRQIIADQVVGNLHPDDRFAVTTSVMIGVWLAANAMYRAIEDAESNNYLATLLAFNAALHRHWTENEIVRPRATFTENSGDDE